MTYLQLQDDIMARLGLSSTDARTQVKRYINQRMRRLQTALGLEAVRFGTITFATVSGTYTYGTTGLVKAHTVVYPVGNKVLEQLTMDQIRLMDPNNDRTGAPEAYAETKFNATTASIYIFPKPNAVFTIQVDGLLVGTDLSADADTPAFTEDFHDALIFGAMADVLDKMEKYDLSKKQEAMYDGRMRELRYFIAKSAYLSNIANTSPVLQNYEPRFI